MSFRISTTVPYIPIDLMRSVLCIYIAMYLTQDKLSMSFIIFLQLDVARK